MEQMMEFEYTGQTQICTLKLQPLQVDHVPRQQQQQQQQQQQRITTVRYEASPRICGVCRCEMHLAARHDGGCDHAFCPKCLKLWMVRYGACPTCKATCTSTVEVSCRSCDVSLQDYQLAGIDCCDHLFCYRCLKTSSRKSKTCPKCRKVFSRVDCDMERHGSACQICFGEVEVKATTDAPDCGHVFCLGCLSRRAETDKTCPECRRAFDKIVSCSGDDDDDESDRNVCRLCFRRVRMAARTNACRHPFCYGCIRRHRQKNETDPRCPQCLESFTEVVASLDRDTCLSCFNETIVRSTADVCEHAFCYRCLRDRKRLDGRCPECAAEFTRILGGECVVCRGKVDDDNRGAVDGCEHVFCYTCLERACLERRCECPSCGKAYARFFHLVLDFTEIFRLRLRLGDRVVASRLEGRVWNFEARDDDRLKWYALLY